MPGAKVENDFDISPLEFNYRAVYNTLTEIESAKSELDHLQDAFATSIAPNETDLKNISETSRDTNFFVTQKLNNVLGDLDKYLARANKAAEIESRLGNANKGPRYEEPIGKFKPRAQNLHLNGNISETKVGFLRGETDLPKRKAGVNATCVPVHHNHYKAHEGHNILGRGNSKYRLKASKRHHRISVLAESIERRAAKEAETEMANKLSIPTEVISPEISHSEAEAVTTSPEKLPLTQDALTQMTIDYNDNFGAKSHAECNSPKATNPENDIHCKDNLRSDGSFLREELDMQEAKLLLEKFSEKTREAEQLLDDALSEFESDDGVSLGSFAENDSDFSSLSISKNQLYPKSTVAEEKASLRKAVDSNQPPRILTSNTNVTTQNSINNDVRDYEAIKVITKDVAESFKSVVQMQNATFNQILSAKLDAKPYEKAITADDNANTQLYSNMLSEIKSNRELVNELKKDCEERRSLESNLITRFVDAMITNTKPPPPCNHMINDTKPACLLKVADIQTDAVPANRSEVVESKPPQSEAIVVTLTSTSTSDLDKSEKAKSKALDILDKMIGTHDGLRPGARDTNITSRSQYRKLDWDSDDVDYTSDDSVF